jgi:post-segregation antitoxin (ccd killing protein)
MPAKQSLDENHLSARISNCSAKTRTAHNLRAMQIKNYLALCSEAEKLGKKIVSITLDPDLADYAKNKLNASAYIQQLIEKDMSKEQPEKNDEETKLIEQLSDIMAKYGIYKLPNFENMKDFTAYVDEEGDFNDFKERNPAPEHYLFSIIMYSNKDLSETRFGREYNPEHKQLLKQARKIPIEKRITLLWQAIQKAMRKTEIKEGLPLIQFVADNLIDFNLPYEDLDQAKTEKTTINELAEKAGIPFQQFYTKHIEKIKTILYWNGVDIEI